MITVDFLQRPLAPPPGVDRWLRRMVVVALVVMMGISSAQYLDLWRLRQRVEQEQVRRAQRVSSEGTDQVRVVRGVPRKWTDLLLALPDLGATGTRWTRLAAGPGEVEADVQVPSWAEMTLLVRRLAERPDVMGVEVRRVASAGPGERGTTGLTVHLVLRLQLAGGLSK